MNKVLFFGIVLIIILCFNVFAGDDPAEQKMIEDSPTAGSRAALAMQFAQQRIDAVKNLDIKNELNSIVRLCLEYKDRIQKAVTYLDQAQQQNESMAAALESLQNSLAEHVKVLNTFAKAAPYTAQGKIYQAINTANDASIKAEAMLEKEEGKAGDAEKQKQKMRRLRHRGR